MGDSANTRITVSANHISLWFVISMCDVLLEMRLEYSTLHNSISSFCIVANVFFICRFIYYFARGSGCKVLWWVCLSVCLSVREDISGTTRAIFTRFFCACCLCPWLGPPPACWLHDRPHRLSAGRGNGSAQRGGSLIYDCLVWCLCLVENSRHYSRK